MAADYEDRFWQSEDGLRLHYRDYPGAAERPPVLCLPGLTRNARDFDQLASHLAGQWRVLCPDFRGRGDSDYAPDPRSYTMASYHSDIQALLSQEGIDRFVAIGTSLGGLVAMLLALSARDRIAGAVFNDVGPEVDPRGIERLRGLVGQGRSFETWMHAARALEEVHGEIYPDWVVSDWLTLAKRTMTLGSNGRIVFDYDMKIAEMFNAVSNGPAVDLWQAWGALEGRPLLLLRGATSDILAEETVENMLAIVPEAELVTIDRVGHAPTLDEPEALAAIDRLLLKVA
jgi:pimeloyl-ACP methyl ester carboxylesterase